MGAVQVSDQGPVARPCQTAGSDGVSIDAAFARAVELIRDLRLRIATLTQRMPPGREVEAGHFAARATKQMSRLVTFLQTNDAADQRVAHVREALARLDGVTAAEAAPVIHVLTVQLDAIVDLLEECVASAEGALETLVEGANDLLEGDTAAVEAALGDPMASWAPIRRDLMAAERMLADAAAKLSGLLTDPLDAEDLRRTELDWLMALYTMDAERQVHQRAMAG